MRERPRAPDQAERDRFVGGRGVNVVGDAGAGTGKTTLLVDRLVRLVAPEDDGPALPLGRLAAITFTRKAAGELKLRIRQALLRERARPDLAPPRRDRLAAALNALDTAWVGTIHSFADRLLRLRPVEARLSPSYEVVDDGADLAAETFAVFLEAVEAGTLPDELAGSGIPRTDLQAAQAAFVDALRAGIRPERREHAYGEIPGLDRLVERLVLTRDVPPVVPTAEPPDLSRFRDLVDEYLRLSKASSGSGRGSRYVAATRERLERVRDGDDPVVILKQILRSRPLNLQKGRDFPGDDAGWALCKALLGDDGKKALRGGSLYQDLLDPFARWMVRRLLAAGPAVVATYERVKARHRAVDQVDLLLRLRDLLRERLDVRAEYQALFDHVLLDEFQDTDPLQAETVLYLCEQGAAAREWRQVVLAPGKLTIVGDPKQSIYRFRRADIAVYDEVRRIVERGPHLVARLTANFRSQPGLIEWLNARFDDLLGKLPADGRAFDAAAGTVANEKLLAGRQGAVRPCVEVLPLASESRNVDAFRETEARALAAWLRRLVEQKKRTIADPATGEPRPIRHGDVAVLAFATRDLPLLFLELDRLGVPYTARGGSLFLGDPLHRQFLLGLRAIADREDGVAQAALLRAPFFALDYDDLAREKAADPASTHPGVVRARAARALVQDLRQRRLERSPGSTARDLLERTAFARAAALGPNGAQRLEALRELCLALDAVAAEGLDYDGATARLRAWIEHPVQLDPPPPVWDDAVQVLTVHQAKGLEFPVVVLWDCKAKLDARDVPSPFAVERTGKSWAVAIDGLDVEEPAGGGFAGREKLYLDAERKRLVYVAATRARDLLVLPVAGAPDPKLVTGRLVVGAPGALMEAREPYAAGAEPAWAKEVAPPAPRPRGDASALATEVAEAWRAAAAESARPRYSPTAVTAESHAAVEEDRPGETAATRPERKSRFGRVFGDTVHTAIGLALRDPSLAPAAAVARAAAAMELADHRSEAADDVARALAALGKAGLRRAPGPDLRLEYPVAQAREGRLVAGYVDLVAADGRGLSVVDFKTDAPPAGDVAATHPAYVEQVRAYARMLEELGLAAQGTVRAGLLFTAEEEIRWVP